MIYLNTLYIFMKVKKIHEFYEQKIVSQNDTVNYTLL